MPICIDAFHVSPSSAGMTVGAFSMILYLTALTSTSSSVQTNSHFLKSAFRSIKSPCGGTETRGHQSGRSASISFDVIRTGGFIKPQPLELENGQNMQQFGISMPLIYTPMLIPPLRAPGVFASPSEFQCGNLFQMLHELMYLHRIRS